MSVIDLAFNERVLTLFLPFLSFTSRLDFPLSYRGKYLSCKVISTLSSLYPACINSLSLPPRISIISSPIRVHVSGRDDSMGIVPSLSILCTSRSVSKSTWFRISFVNLGAVLLSFALSSSSLLLSLSSSAESTNFFV